MGRTSLMLIMVFNMTFMYLGFRLATAASSAYEKYCAYADIEQAGMTLESAANIAISNSLMTAPVAVDTFLCTNDAFGKAIFTIKRIPRWTAFGNRDGDSLVVFGSYPLTGSVLSSITCTTSVRVKGNAFSQYVFYSESEKIGTSPIYWGAGDTCRGRLHTQDNLYTNGKADFKGKVTTKGNVTSSGTAPVFEQGHTKADVAIPSSLNDLTTLGASGEFISGLNTYVEFLPDGRVIVRTGANGWSETSTAFNASPNGTVPKCTVYASVAAVAASGVLLVQDAELHVKGKLNGSITLGCVESTSSGTLSKVFIDSSLTYSTPPPSTKNPSNVSTSMLGIVATNDIMVSQYINHFSGTGKVNLTNVTINASMFSQKGGFGAENYSTRGASGKLSIVGGIQQHVRRPVAQLPDGFLKDYDFDNNLLTRDPAGYPKTPFVIQNWVDYTTIPTSFWQ
jgi:hypothetical protein